MGQQQSQSQSQSQSPPVSGSGGSSASSSSSASAASSSRLASAYDSRAAQQYRPKASKPSSLSASSGASGSHSSSQDRKIPSPSHAASAASSISPSHASSANSNAKSSDAAKVREARLAALSSKSRPQGAGAGKATRWNTYEAIDKAAQNSSSSSNLILEPQHAVMSQFAGETLGEASNVPGYPYSAGPVEPGLGASSAPESQSPEFVTLEQADAQKFLQQRFLYYIPKIQSFPTESLTLIKKILANLVSNASPNSLEDALKFRRLKYFNPKIQQFIVEVHGAMELMLELGWRREVLLGSDGREEEYLVFPDEANIEIVRIVVDKLNQFQ